MGGNSAVYTTAVLGASDDGAQFRVIVSNSAGSATSRVAVLNISASGIGTPGPESHAVNRHTGANAHFNGAASIEIFDRYGNSVGKVDGDTWDGRRSGGDVASGVYVCKIYKRDGTSAITNVVVVK